MTTVLLADHHVLYRQGLAALLREQGGWQVVGEAGSGDEAVHLAGTLKPGIAVLDIELPGTDGAETARAVRKASRETRIVMLSMYAHPQYQGRMLEAGASAYVLKSEPIDALVVAMQVILRNGTFVSRAAMKREAVTAVRSAKLDKETLSAREQEVLRLLAQGRRTREAAELLAVSPKTIETYRLRIREKLGVQTLPDMVRFAINAGLISTES
jgi:DNA-binding NarL/FixJ family response regulator